MPASGNTYQVRHQPTGSPGATLRRPHPGPNDRPVTWSAPELLADDLDNDREWIARGPRGELAVTWQDSGSALAASLDGGRTWTHARLAEGCVGTARVAFHQGAAFSACVRLAGGAPAGIDVLRVDLATGNATLVARLGLRMVWPDLHDLGGTLGMTLEDYANGTVAYVASRDGGRTWSAPIDVGGLTKLDDGWTRTFAQATVASPAGLLHVILGGAPPQPAGLDAATGPPHRGANEFVHLALDPAGRLVQERALTSAADAPRAGVSPPFNSDYAGLAFAGDDALLAWPHGGAVDLTRATSG